MSTTNDKKDLWGHLRVTYNTAPRENTHGYTRTDYAQDAAAEINRNLMDAGMTSWRITGNAMATREAQSLRDHAQQQIDACAEGIREQLRIEVEEIDLSPNGWLKFPNGKVWFADDGWITGSVNVRTFADSNEEAFLDALSEAAVGSSSGLMDFSWRAAGNGAYSFRGSIAEMVDQEMTEGEIKRLGDDAEISAALQAQYDIEVEVATMMIKNAYRRDSDALSHQEITAPFAGTAYTLHRPKDAEADSYFRLTLDGIEISRVDPQMALQANRAGEQLLSMLEAICPRTPAAEDNNSLSM